MKRILACIAPLALCACATLARDPGFPGVIVASDSQSIRVRHKSGREVTVLVTGSTILIGPPASSATPDLQPGRRVLVAAEESAAGLVAREIRVSSGRFSHRQ